MSTEAMTGVEEYSEGYEVELCMHDGHHTVKAYNQGRYDCTQVDLEQLLKWVADNKPDLYQRCAVK